MSARLYREIHIIKKRRRAALREQGRPVGQEVPSVTSDELERLDAQMPLNPARVTQRNLWMLRLVLESPHINGRRSPLDDDDVLGELGCELEGLEGLEPEVIRSWVAHRIEQIERLELVPDSIAENSRWLVGWLGLTDVQGQLLALAATAGVSGPLRTCMRPFGRLSAADAIRLLARVLDASPEDIRSSLSPRSQLVRAGLLEFQPARDQHHDDWLKLQHPFDNVFSTHYEQPDELFAAICPRASLTPLSLDAFQYVARDTELLCALLRGALRERTLGVNVLLYGPPGSGKSQLVRAIAQALDLPLRQVPDVAPDGDVLKGEERLAALSTMQYLLQSSAPSLVLFDEIEDAFPWTVEGGWLRQGSGNEKARTNRLLEENPVPCIWVGNRVTQLDPAFARRFSLVLELPCPPRPIREGLLSTYATGLDVCPALLSQLADDARLMPADMARAASVTALVRIGSSLGSEPSATKPAQTSHDGEEPGAAPLDPPLADARVFQRALHGARRPTTELMVVADLPYDPKLVNASVSLERLTSGLKQRPQGCICLYGPPGTGKTAYARQLATALGRPLLHRSAGDLLDMFVGGTEKAITEMFEEASRSDRVLLLDEAEGLMRDRSGAAQGFEITRVNELLVRMESFRGIFLCATNGFEVLDAASLRRFSLRVEFFPLRVDQNLTLLRRTAAELRLDLCDHAERMARRRLASLDLLTPGDYASVLRGRRLLGDSTLDAILSDLERAQTEKRADRRIGFRG